MLIAQVIGLRIDSQLQRRRIAFRKILTDRIFCPESQIGVTDDSIRKTQEVYADDEKKYEVDDDRKSQELFSRENSTVPKMPDDSPHIY
jgi:hypothetical protein